jgi:hypothetical protein
LNTIRDMDHLYRNFINGLDKAGKLEDSIIIVTSDHSQKWDSIQRVPLLIRFPYSQNRGRVKRNVSLAQIPATMLDYMGIMQPDWMSQESLFSVPEPNNDLEVALTIGGSPPILSLATFDYSKFKLPGGHLSKMDNPGAPLYGVREVGLIVGSNWMKLNLQTGKLRNGAVKGHTNIDKVDVLPPNKLVKKYIVRHLEREHFQVPVSSWTEPFHR